MFPELKFHLKAVTRLIYFVTEEEDRFLVQLRDALKEKVANAKVYNSAFGLLPLTDLIDDWKKKAHPTDNKTVNIHDALISIYKDETPHERKVYVITDPDRWLKDEQVQRRVMNIMHQAHNDEQTVKILICVGSRQQIPEKLTRYTEVIQDSSLSSDEILQIVTSTCDSLKIDAPKEPDALFQGLTSFEIQTAMIQTFMKVKSADPRLLAAYRFRQLRKTNLVKYIDTSEYSFQEIGGISRFKEWALLTKAAWSSEGRAFGLEPPKGILAVGIWGTGKSLSIKTLGNVWGLPVIQLEMGKLRSSGVGDTEGNVYRAIKVIEAMAPCIVWIDEAEKSLSGGQSSAHTDAGTASRAIGILSTWMQETKSQICMAMTANSLKTLPVEFVNRMDERWFFDLPSKEDRIDILKIHLQKRGQEPSRFNLDSLAETSKSLVGREIEQCVKAAMTASFHKNPKGGLDEELFTAELARKPRIVKTMVAEINETLEWIGYDPDVDDGVRARFAADPSGQERRFSVV
jgi:AAA+ superfamily predicted ATPase